MAIEQLLKKLKVIDILQFELDIQLEDFVEKLNSTVDKEKTGAFKRADEYYSKSKSIYVGEVDDGGFWIRAARRERMSFPLPKDFNLGYAEGTFEQKESKLIVTATLKGYSRRIKFYLKLFGAFYLVSIVLFFLQACWYSGVRSFSLFFPLLMLFHIGVVGLFSIIFMRGFVSKMKKRLPEQFLEILKS